MKKKIDIESWERKEHYHFFSQFEEPFFGVTVNVDCTKIYQATRSINRSFYLAYLFRALKAANETNAFRYRIVNNEVYDFTTVHAAPTIPRSNGTFGFGYFDYLENEKEFVTKALPEIEIVKNSQNLTPAISGENVIHFSALPWLEFTGVTHARSFSFPDSCPKICFGKIALQKDRCLMPVSITVHHGLMDGYHVGLFVDTFQRYLDNEQLLS